MLEFFESDEEEERPSRGGQYFFPALSCQRYDKVLDELLRHEEIIDKLVDFGCNECKFLMRAKHKLQRTPLMFGVDLDEKVFEKACETLRPYKTNYLYKLDYSLRMKLFAGSVGQYDRRLDGTDAVVAIELIEHLNYRALQKFPEVIFGKIQPFIVIITTPNVEFNVVFDMGERKFRHDDHKFEWTRAEFENWCDKITLQYRNYWVKFTGVGNPPPEKKNIGFCTQIAIFRMKRVEYLKLRNAKREIRLKEREQFADPGYSSETEGLETNCSILQPYKLIEDFRFPSKASEGREGRMLLDLRCYCENLIEFGNLPIEDLDGKTGVWFAVSELRKCAAIKRYLKTDDDVALFLVDYGWIVKLRENKVFYDTEPDRGSPNDGDNSKEEEEEEDYFWNKDNVVLSYSEEDTGISSQEFGTSVSLEEDKSSSPEVSSATNDDSE